jgi:hypothetical protein
MSIKSLFIASALAASSLVSAASLPHHVARQELSTNPTCSGKAQGDTLLYKPASGNTYDVVCGSDYFGGDLRLEWTSNFKGCLDICDAEAECVTVSYRDGACYLKKEETRLDPNTSVWAAKKTLKSAAPSCVDGVSTVSRYISSNGVFQIICGKEYRNGDLPATTTSSFEACIEVCAANEECIDVS